MRSRAALLRFCLVGGTVALVYVLLYAGFRALGLPELVANGAAFALAVALQYAGQGALTFRRRLADAPQVMRFAVMIGCGFVTSTLIAVWAGPALGLADWMAAAFVAVLLPVQNFILMSAWVFARPPVAAGDLS